MKNKLLIALLSVLMIATSFTTNIFANDINTISDILQTVDGDFPSQKYEGWINTSDSDKVVSVSDGTIQFEYIDHNNVYSFADIASNSIESSGDNYIYRSGNTEYEFVMTSGKLSSIEFTSTDTNKMELNGTYIPVGLGTQSNPWKIGATGNLSSVTAYIDNSTLYINGSGNMAEYKYPKRWPWNTYVDSINEVIINSGVTNIGLNAFKSFSILTSVSIPNTVVSINALAFENCESLENITIPNSVTKIGDEAFAGAGLTSFVIPNSVTNFGEWVFDGCSNLNTVICNAINPPTLDDDIFDGCPSTLKIKVPPQSIDLYSNPDSSISKGWYEYVDSIETATTIADVLPDDFPQGTSAGAWYNGDIAYLNIEFIVDHYELSFYYSDDIRADIPTTNAVDDNNEYTDGTITVKFNITDGVLENVTLSGHESDDLNGTYVRPLTIAEVLEKSKESFPTSIDKAWKNDDGAGFLKGTFTNDHGETYDVLSFTLDGVTAIPFSGRLDEPLIGTKNPFIEFGGDGKVVFNLENDVLVSIELIEIDDLINGVYKPEVITPTPTPAPIYVAPKTGVE